MAKENALQYKYDLAKLKNCNIKSFVIRETDGEDEETAAVLAKAKGEGHSSFEELVRMSLVYVDGKKIEQPYEDFDGWNSRTRAFVLQAFKALNSVEEKEVGDFLSGALLVASQTSESGAENSGEVG